MKGTTAGVLTLGLLLSWAPISEHAVAAGIEIGKAAPDFTLKSLSGTNIRLREQRGRVVMINFWASWCGPCRQEMPELDKLYVRFRNAGFEMLGVNVEEQSGKAVELARLTAVRYPILFDLDKRVSELYKIGAMPTTVLLDRSGRVRYVHRGYLPGYEQTYQTQIKELIRE